MAAAVIDRNSVRAALKLWQSAPRLGAHPFAAWPAVRARRSSAGLDDTPAGNGLALRELLRDTIASLKPDGAPDWGAKRWRPYLILTEQYFDGRKPEYLADRLGLVRGSFHHEQAAALDLLADKLRELALTHAPDDAPVTRAVHTRPFLAPPQPPEPLLGREALLATLTGQLTKGGARLALHGLPGSGKSAIAIALAHHPDVLARFDDGVLWVGVGREPDVFARLGAWAAALGFTQDDIARLATPEARVAAIRGAIGVRRMLLILDDVWHASDADALLLGGPHCAHVLTTRIPEVALQFAPGGAHAVPELDEPDAIALIARHAPQAAHGQRAGLAAAARHCGGLPLALSLVGAQLRRASLGNITRRTQQLLAGLARDPREVVPFAALDEAIAASTDQLLPGQQQALGALALLPAKPNTFDEDVALALMDDVSLLDALVDDGLVEARDDGRYALHLAIAEFARQHLSTAPLQHAHALARHFAGTAAHHAHDYGWFEREAVNLRAALDLAAGHAGDALPELSIAAHSFYEGRGMWADAKRELERALPHADDAQAARILARLGRVARHTGDYDAAHSFYQAADTRLAITGDSAKLARAELLLNTCTLANDRGDRELAEDLGGKALAAIAGVQEAGALHIDVLTQLAAAAGFRGKLDLARARLDEALDLATRAGNTRALALLHLGIGFVESWVGHVPEAERSYEASVRAALQHDQRETASIARSLQAWVACNRGEYARTEALCHEGLGLIREGSFCESLGLLYANLGLAAINQGRWQQAEALTKQGLDVVERIQHKEGRLLLLGNLARMQFERGDLAQCDAISRDALQQADALAFYELMCPLLATFGECLDAQGQRDEADGVLLMALGMAHEMQRPWLLTYALNVFGSCWLRRGDGRQALSAFEESLKAAEAVDSASFIGVARFGLGRAHALLGDRAAAEVQARAAHATLAAIGHYKAADVAAWQQSVAR